MSPEFNRFKHVLQYIADNHSEMGSEPIDFQCKMDELNSTSDNQFRFGNCHMVMYVFYGKNSEGQDLFEYFEFDIPARERKMFDLELGNFMSWLG